MSKSQISSLGRSYEMCVPIIYCFRLLIFVIGNIRMGLHRQSIANC